MKSLDNPSLSLVRFLVLFFFFGLMVDATAYGKVYFYEKVNFQGFYKKLDPGTYPVHEFGKLKNALYKYGGYCSIRIPKGYLVDLDYTGHGFHDGKVVTYRESKKRVRVGFKKVRIRYAGRAQQPVRSNWSRAAFDDWHLVIFDYPQYTGERHTFGTGSYYGGKHCSNFYDRNFSFRLRKGYAVWFYDREGKMIGKAYGDVKEYRKGFHKFVVSKEKL